MTIYTVTSKQLLNDYAVLQTLENASFEIGQTITVDDVGGDFDGEVVVYAIPQYYYIGTDGNGFPAFNPNIPINNQVMYVAVGDAVERAPATGTIEFDPVCEWIDDGDIADWLGIEVATDGDEAFLVICAAAANAFCSLRRFENGYFAHPLEFVFIFVSYLDVPFGRRLFLIHAPFMFFSCVLPMLFQF